MDALAPVAEERRGKLRKAPVSCKRALDPEISEWGQPAAGNAAASLPESIGQEKGTGELKHLSTPRKRKETSGVPPVAASEEGRA